MNKSEQFEQLLEEVKADPNILGFVLIGSRGKGFENEYSDYDALMVVAENEVSKYRERYEIQELEQIDLGVKSLSDFQKYAAWDSPEAWDRYDFTHVKILVDKTGGIAPIVQEIGTISEQDKDRLVSGWLDAYINSVYRSVKCIRNNNHLGALLESATSVHCLLDVLFGLHNRPKPFVNYLEKEIQMYPLEKLPWSVKQFTDKIQTILKTADLKTQQEVLSEVEKLARSEGFGKVFDDWEGKDRWAMEHKP